MVLSVFRLTVLTAALLGVVSANPIEPELQVRAAAAILKCTRSNTVALTFDDGPYVSNRQIVDLLDANGAKGTFFVNGNNYGCIYDQANVDRLKYAHSKGHQIASHTWAHKDLATLSGSALKSEFTKLDTATKKILGVKAKHMRPPYGSRDDEVLQVAEANGQKVVIWDLDSGDSAGKSAAQSKALYKSALAKTPKNILTLNHETYASTANDILPGVIKQIKAKGYKMVTVAECLGQAPYASPTSAPGKRDSTWKC